MKMYAVIQRQDSDTTKIYLICEHYNTALGIATKLSLSDKYSDYYIEECEVCEE